MRSDVYLLICASLGLILLSSGCAAISVGVSPGTIRFDEILRGGYAEEIIVISTSSKDELTARINVDGEIADWLTFENTRFDISPDSLYRLNVVLEPPDDVANGEYNGVIYVNVRPKTTAEGEGSRMGVAVAAGIKTAVEITDRQIKRYAYSDVMVKDIEEGNPIEVKVNTINTGNVRVSPEIRVEILDQMQQNVVKSMDYSETELLPTTRGEILIEIPTDDLKLGQYWARVTMSLDGEKLGTEIITFDYLERGALRVKGVLNYVASNVWTQVGDTARMDAVFSNIGEMVTLAKAKFQIYLDGSLKKVVDSEEIRVEVGDTMNMTAFFEPEEVGKYEIFGTVYYSGKISEERSTILNVYEETETEAASAEPEVQEGQGGGGDLTWMIILLVIIVAALFLVRLMNSKKRGSKGGRKRSGLSRY